MKSGTVSTSFTAIYSQYQALYSLMWDSEGLRIFYCGSLKSLFTFLILDLLLISLWLTQFLHFKNRNNNGSYELE